MRWREKEGEGRRREERKGEGRKGRKEGGEEGRREEGRRRGRKEREGERGSIYILVSPYTNSTIKCVSNNIYLLTIAINNAH